MPEQGQDTNIADHLSSVLIDPPLLTYFLVNGLDLAMYDFWADRFPVPADLPGRVMTGMIEPDFLRAHPVRTIASYD